VLKQILHWLMSCWIAALQAAEEGDMATAAQLWQAMQADSILPNRKVLNNYLM
jgi:ribosomal protein L20